MTKVSVSKTRQPFRFRFPISKGKSPAFRPAGDKRLTRRENQIAALFEQAVSELPDTLALDVFEANDPNQTLALLTDAFSSVAPQIATVLWQQLGDSGRQALEEIAPQLAREYRRVGKATRPSDLVMTFQFQDQAPEAVAWARQESARLVTNMVQQQQAAIRGIIADGIFIGQTRGQQSRALVDLLARTKPSKTTGVALLEELGTNMNGLTVRYERAVVNMAEKLADDLALEVDDDKAAKIIRDKTRRYSDKLRRARARTIARTEIQRAHNQGRLESYRQLMDAGLVSPQAQKKWVISPFDVCPICVPLSDELVAVNSTFSNGSQTPPAHPNCRCSTIMVTNPELYEPPQSLGTGAPDDPFRVQFPSMTPNFDDLSSRPLA